MFNSNRELSKQGGASNCYSAVPTGKIRRYSGNDGCSAAAAMADVEDAGSTVCSTNKINFMCNFSKNMISSPQFLGNLANPASDAMLKLRRTSQDGSGSFATNDMGQHGTKKGWTEAKDKIEDYVPKHGEENWSLVPKNFGLMRSGRSCRSRWVNFLMPDLKKKIRYRSMKKDILPSFTEGLVTNGHYCRSDRTGPIAR